MSGVPGERLERAEILRLFALLDEELAARDVVGEVLGSAALASGQTPASRCGPAPGNDYARSPLNRSRWQGLLRKDELTAVAMKGPHRERPR